MSPTLAIVSLIGLVVGHAALAVWFLSQVHGYGLSPRWMNRFSAVPLVLPALIAVAMAWLILARPVAAWPTAATAYACLCMTVAYVILPAITLHRNLRREPRGVTTRSEAAVLELPEGGSRAWIGDGPHAWLLRLPGNEALTLDWKTCEVRHPALPRSFGPLRILHLSDFHFARCYDPRYFEAVAEAASGWDADLVLFTGDLLDADDALDWTGPVLGRLRGRLGQYAILGNHDVVHRPGRVRRALRAAGFAVIDGRWTTIEDGDRTIALGGTSYPWGPALDHDARPDADATIVLSHSPDLFPRIARWGTVDLILAGHNHGGQVRLPWIGPVVMPSRYGRRYDRGFYRRGRTILEVTQGVGGRHPIRYGCPPEIVRLTLMPAGLPAHPSASSVALMSDSTSRT